VCPKKFKAQNSSSKVLASVFWGKDGILLVDYLETDATITAKHYIVLLHKLKQQLVLFLQDNSAPHKAAIIQQKF
jgi:hypothetical protein